MEGRQNYKYVIRKEAALDLADVPVAENSFRRKFFSFWDRFLFGRPHLAFIVFIVFIALPISIIFVVVKDVQGSLVGTTYIYESRVGHVPQLTPNRVYEQSYDFEMSEVEQVEITEITSPEWFTQRYLDNVDAVVSYKGKPEYDVNDRFVLLAQAQKVNYYDCSGCDADARYSYALVEYNLNTRACSDSKVWGRNPLGYSNPYSETSFCKQFDNECVVSSSWRYFASEEECVNSQNPPQIITPISDEVVYFESDCDGAYMADTIELDKKIEATDRDGEIVRFSITSSLVEVELQQDSIETLVRQISSEAGGKYYEAVYGAMINLQITPDVIGGMVPLTLSACDMLGHCDVQYMNISVLKRESCQQELPETGLPYFHITNPIQESTVRGSVPIVWDMGGYDTYEVLLNLYQNDCTTFVKKIEQQDMLTLNGNKGFVKMCSSELLDNGEYCVRGYMRQSGSSGGWMVSDQVQISVRNDNHRPVITSTPPAAELVTGANYEYIVSASDEDGDKVNLSIVGLPDWLNFDGSKISGTTVVPGGYSFSIIASDHLAGEDIQLVAVNVVPPINDSTKFTLHFPHEESVLSGSSNLISWEAQDEDGISHLEIYYSHDQKKWTQLGTYVGGKREAEWDVSSLANGNYWLKFVFEDGCEQQVTSVFFSEVFFVSQGDLEAVAVSFPAIFDMAPHENAELFTTSPLIYANYAPSEGTQIEQSSVKVLLDGGEITEECEIDETHVNCALLESLARGQHKVRINVADSSGRSMSTEWLFQIVEAQIIPSSLRALDLSEPPAKLFGIQTAIPISIVAAVIVLLITVILFTGFPLLFFGTLKMIIRLIRRPQTKVTRIEVPDTLAI